MLVQSGEQKTGMVFALMELHSQNMGVLLRLYYITLLGI